MPQGAYAYELNRLTTKACAASRMYITPCVDTGEIGGATPLARHFPSIKVEGMGVEILKL